MTLELDERQRAMLLEMGIRVFLPEEPPLASATAVAETLAPQPGRTRPAEASAPVAAPVAKGVPADVPSLLQVDGLDAAAFEQAVREWAGRRGSQPVIGIGDPRPTWLCLGDPPDEEEERLALPFAGPRGELLDNMLRALGVSRTKGAYLANSWKCRLPAGRAPSPEDAMQQQAFLRRQVELLRPRVILAMGRHAVQALLDSSEPPGRLRGRVHEYLGIPVVVTYPPVSLLRTPADKAKAWADLCLARTVLQEGA